MVTTDMNFWGKKKWEEVFARIETKKKKYYQTTKIRQSNSDIENTQINET